MGRRGPKKSPASQTQNTRRAGERAAARGEKPPAKRRQQKKRAVPQKPTSRRTSTGRELVVASDSAPSDVPEPSSTWRESVVAQWDDYWSSPAALAARPEHLPAIRRRFDLLEEYEVAIDQVRRNPAVTGSKDQIKASPFYAVALALHKAALEVERELGLTPRAAAELGIAAGEARLTAAKVNAMARENRGGDTVDVDEVEDAELLGEFEEEST